MLMKLSLETMNVVLAILETCYKFKFSFHSLPLSKLSIYTTLCIADKRVNLTLTKKNCFYVTAISNVLFFSITHVLIQSSFQKPFRIYELI